MRTARRILFIVVLVCAAQVAAADPTEDTPDSEVNPQSGYIETVDPVQSGSNQDLRYVIDHGISSSVFLISNDPAPDQRPRMRLAPNGDSWVVWWRDETVDTVLFRKRSYSTGSWASERVLSASSESSRDPVVAYDGSSAWVAYAFDDTDGTAVGVNKAVDEPDPISDRVKLAEPEFGGELDVLILTESGHLWVTWVDSSSDVGWCEYDYGSETWSSPTYESYATDSVEDARERVRSSVIGN